MPRASSIPPRPPSSLNTARAPAKGGARSWQERTQWSWMTKQGEGRAGHIQVTLVVTFAYISSGPDVPVRIFHRSRKWSTFQFRHVSEQVEARALD